MVIGRSEDRDNPRCPAVFRHHCRVWHPICKTHLGQRPSVPRTKHALAKAGGRTYDRNRPEPFPLPSPCEAGAVHISAPAFAGVGKQWVLSVRSAGVDG